ncbi:MAG: hypothetical protein NTZ13_02020 [Candidatus Parcubacteria bacterium]|nr:hypothetical protein [Candidatus Parcubacteria bacterium]
MAISKKACLSLKEKNDAVEAEKYIRNFEMIKEIENFVDSYLINLTADNLTGSDPIRIILPPKFNLNRDIMIELTIRYAKEDWLIDFSKKSFEPWMISLF